ncbi:MAG TPA: S8 family serine peptidase [Micromonosporaceae bacterium]|nr:S8 family serine peptidase [Micromonosporaceae bacterium]
MKSPERTACGLISVVLVGAALSGTAAMGPASAAPPAAPGPISKGAPTATSAPYEVTLITGDRVSVSATGNVSTTPEPSRRGVTFSVHRDGKGHVHVLPFDAAALVGTGKLDRTLFDVTALAGYGYTSHRHDVPLIVKQGPTGRSAAGSALTRSGAAITRDLPNVKGFAASYPQSEAASFWNTVTTPSGPSRKLRPEVASIWLDRTVRLDLDVSVPRVGAPAAWQDGYDGTGVTVAVLDTGIDDTHPDLAGKVVAAQNFTTEPTAEDMFGHGTHVASIVVGTGAASDGRYRGVAPGATVLNGKVCMANRNCPWSSIIAGLKWAGDHEVDVANLSLSGPDTPGVDPVEEAVNNLTADHHTLVVAGSGNTPTGAEDYSVGSPGTADTALSVGAVDDDDNLAGFSNRGPRVGDHAVKPDMTAPGVAVRAARSSTGSMGTPGERYVDANGTSMAAPHVSGAAAILVQRHPDWMPAQLKAALMGSARVGAQQSAFQQGAGRLNVERAYRQNLLIDPPSVSLGRQAWPHGDDPVLTRTVTYTNTGGEGMRVQLSLDTRGPDGSPAPAGMFAVEPTSVDLPPGASEQVTLTATTSVDCAVGSYSGRINAVGAAGGIWATVPFGVVRGEEEYQVTVTNINRNGEQDRVNIVRLYPLTPGNPYYEWVTPPNPLVATVKKGVYQVESLIADLDPATGGQRTSMMTNPRLPVTADRTVTFDARTAGRATASITDDPLAKPFGVQIFSQTVENGEYAIGGGLVTWAEPNDTVYFGQSDRSQWENGFMGKVVVHLAQPGPAGDLANSPRSYQLAAYFPGNLPSGWSPGFATGALARVNVSLVRHLANGQVGKGAVSFPAAGWRGIGTPMMLAFDPPFRHVEYYNVGSNLRWQPVFGDSVVDLEGGLNAYAAGITVSQTWNQPVYGPAHGTAANPNQWVTRQGNRITVGLPQMFGDGAGHPGRTWWPVCTGRLVLKRDGAVVATEDYPTRPDFGVDVAGGYATYRLEVTAQRSLPEQDVLSPRVEAAWTFKSDTMNSSVPIRMPIWSVSFRPALNQDNTAAAGTSFAFPASVVPQPDSTAAPLRTVTVQYSTDDGATWADATVTGSGSSRTVRVTHPNTSGYVSLRATATDYAGNGVEQTIMHAYKIAP